MPRTPLLTSVRQLFRDFRISRATGIPLDELPERRTALRLNRRQFLTGAAAGAVALGLPRRARAAVAEPTVAIVGAGIAGLACARKLADHDIDATVYEGSGRLGGRMFSNNGGYWDAAQVSEWCGELIDTGHTTVRRLAKRFGLPLDNLHAAEPKGSTETYRFFGRYYPKAQADADFLAMFDALDADVTGAGYPTTFDLSTPTGQTLDHMSVYDWIESRVPGGHGSPLGALLDTAYAIEYGADTTEQAALNLVYLLGFQPTTTQLDVFGASDETFHIRGGNQRLPEAIADSLEAGAVKTGWRLTRIQQTAAGRVVLSFDVGANSREVTADYAVLALPFAVLRDLDYSRAGFDALKDTAIRQLGRGHNGKLHLQLAQRLWRAQHSSGSSYADTGYQASWDVTRAQPGTPGILVAYSGGSVTDGMHTNVPFTTIAANSRVGDDARRALGQLAPVFPGIDDLWNGKATQSLPHKSAFMKASYSYWKVGQYTKFAGYEGVTMGNVLFCGEHTSQDFQGFMEGGASTGQRAADEIVAAVKAKAAV